MTDPLSWPPPGPGPWRLLREHLPRPVSGLTVDLLPLASAGWPQGAARLGLPMGETRWGAVNGWVYASRTPEPPADAALAAAAEATLASRAWRDVVTRWLDDERPAAVARCRAVQAADPAGLDDAGLADHLAAAVGLFAAIGPLHFGHMAAFDVAGGLLVEAAAGWGITGPEVAGLLAGASPASLAVSGALARVAAALGGAVPATLADVRAAGPEAAAALDAFLDERGWCVVYDVAEPTRGERPDLVLAALRAAARAPAGPSPAEQAADRLAAAAARVPAADRELFATLVDDARATYRLRDDDGAVCYGWPLGLVRRAALEAGRRLAGRGRLAAADDVFEATAAELAALLAGDGPPAADLAARTTVRRAAAGADPPPFLDGGPDPAAPAPGAADPVPPAVARLAAARAACWSIEVGAAPSPGGDGSLTGTGIGDGVHTGPALVLAGEGADDDALATVGPGHVLVATTTTSADDPLYSIVGAVVTELGGLLSHAAIMAREHGLPAVVGVAGVVDAVAPGALVEVDATAGTVRVLDPGA